MASKRGRKAAKFPGEDVLGAELWEKVEHLGKKLTYNELSVVIAHAMLPFAADSLWPTMKKPFTNGEYPPDLPRNRSEYYDHIYAKHPTACLAIHQRILDYFPNRGLAQKLVAANPELFPMELWKKNNHSPDLETIRKARQRSVAAHNRMKKGQ